MDVSFNKLASLISASGQGTPLELMRTLFSFPYCSLMGTYFDRTREFELGLLFIGRCYEVLDASAGELADGEYDELEYHLQTMRLGLYDRLNHWGEYLDLFETLFKEKRSQPWIALYEPGCAPARFGRYYLGRAMDGCHHVHKLYLAEARRQVIERKAWRQAAGKNVAYLKCHQKEALSDEERGARYAEMERVLSWMKEYAARRQRNAGL